MLVASSGGGGPVGGADTGCALSSPTNGSEERTPSPTADADADADVDADADTLHNGLNGHGGGRHAAAERGGAGQHDNGGGGGDDARRHLYENPLASAPVAVPGGRRVRDVTSQPHQSPSEKVDAWLLSCGTVEDGRDASESEQEPAPAAAPGSDDSDDESMEDALTDADDLDIHELLSRGCELLELEAPSEEPEAERPDSLQLQVEEPTAAAAPGRDEPTPDDDEGTASASGASSEFLLADRLKRSSSLKSGKTPPLTPGRKKFVRFADALGLDLQQVRTFRDEVPNVPAAAFRGLDVTDLFSASPDSPFLTTFPVAFSALGGCVGSSLDAAQRQLVTMFLQPTSGMGLEDRLRRDKVCLERVSTHDDDWSVRGVVRVLNMDYFKSVCVRYTLDEWRTWSDAVAAYVPGSCDGLSDRFQFRLYCSTLSAGQRLHFAVVFRCQGQEFWDNNGGADYTVLSALANHGSPEEWSGGRF
ncbi:glycogen-binding subunit 76A-like [Pollicipes pollicipes]|uniref:glycogen-binding subunit 76A-like n=1 Tax=Pollicipes pollicipes TaxID=41117 RepID=UPI0018855ECC|nr:glycogen-binding subunit 76A-like [Pollicipes pollicipes]